MKKHVFAVLYVVASLTFGAAILIPAVSFAAFNTDLGYGSTGTNVAALQQFLTSQGLYSGPMTTSFYSLTQAAVVRFQIKEGITPASGYFGPLTRKIANALAATSTAPTQTTSASMSTSVAPAASAASAATAVSQGLVIQSITPASAMIGSQVTITTNAHLNAYNTVTLSYLSGTTTATTSIPVYPVTSTQVSFVVPPSLPQAFAGIVGVQISNAAYGSNTNGSQKLTIVPTPIMSVTPLFGPIGTTLTISGPNLAANGTITFTAPGGAYYNTTSYTTAQNSIQFTIPATVAAGSGILTTNGLNDTSEAVLPGLYTLYLNISVGSSTPSGFAKTNTVQINVTQS